jgi:hypothetical protein
MRAHTRNLDRQQPLTNFYVVRHYGNYCGAAPTLVTRPIALRLIGFETDQIMGVESDDF